MIGNNFIEEILKKETHCSEFGIKLNKGDTCLVSMRKGKVRKRVCSENCRLEFDAKLWECAANKNAIRRVIHAKT